MNPYREPCYRPTYVVEDESPKPSSDHFSTYMGWTALFVSLAVILATLSVLSPPNSSLALTGLAADVLTGAAFFRRAVFA